MRQFSLTRFASKKNIDGVDSKVIQIEMRRDRKKGCEREHEEGTKFSLGNLDTNSIG